MLEQGLYHLLVTDSGIQAVAPNVYLGILPKQYQTPCIRLQNVGSENIVTMDSTAALRAKRMQFDCYAPLGQYVKAHQIALAVKALLQDYRGNLVDDSNNVLATITASEVLMELDEPLEEGTGGFLHRTVVDINFWFTEPGE